MNPEIEEISKAMSVEFNKQISELTWKAMDTRNVADKFKGYWTTEAIKADLDARRHNFSVLCANIQGDFNIGSVIRNGNAFLANEIVIYGNKKYDKRGTVGTHLYSNFKHVRSYDIPQILSTFADSQIIGVDNLDGALPIETFKWDYTKHTLICFGEEQVGLPKEILDICHSLVYIKQYGSVRSLNVGCASAITMYDYVNKMS